MEEFCRVKSTLIELVREKEELWNQKSSLYILTKSGHKKQMWAQIGKVLNIDGKYSQIIIHHNWNS